MNKFINKILAGVLALVLCGFTVFNSSLFVFGQTIISGVIFTDIERADGSADSDSQSSYQANTLQVTFLNVGMGDCTFIRYNDTQILIDSGEKTDKNEQGILNDQGIVDYVKSNLGEDDTVLDYVIVTHGDSDHLGVMDKILSEFNSTYTVGTIIDFDSLYYEAFYLAKKHKDEYNKNKDFYDSKAGLTSSGSSDETDSVQESDYSDKIGAYRTQRNKLIKNSKTKYYCVAERSNNNVEYTAIFKNDESISNINNKNSVFRLGDDSSAPVLKILYNKNYFDLLRSDEMLQKIDSMYAYYVNTKSVCSMIQYGKTKVLITGDIEESHGMNGESNLVNVYKEADEELLKNVTLYKAAHHGSNTSNSKALLSVIRPKYIAISALANSAGDKAGSYWNFPRQSVLDDFLSITDKIFITARYNEASGVSYSYHGNISFVMDSQENVTVDCSNKDNSWEIYDENNDLLPLHETKWFKENRTVDFKVLTFSGYKSAQAAYLGNCTLIKYLYYDILIDCGNYGTIGPGAISTTFFLDKVKEEVLDGSLEYVIVTSPLVQSIAQLGNMGKDGEGLSTYFKVGCLIDSGRNINPDKNMPGSRYSAYLNEIYKDLGLKDGKTCFEAKDVQGKKIEIANNLSFTVLKNKYYGSYDDTEKYESFVSVLFDFYDKQLLFMGDLSADGEESIVKLNRNSFKNIVYFKPADFGSDRASSETLLKAIGGKNLNIVLNSIDRRTVFGCELLNDEVENRFKQYSGNVWVTMGYESKSTDRYEYAQICGDITFYITNANGNLTTNVQTSVNNANN